MKAPTIRDSVLEAHRDFVVFDLHVDVILQQRLFGYDISKAHRPWMRRQPFWRHADVPRMLEGGYSGVSFGIHYWRKETPKGWVEVQKQLDYMEKVAATDERVVLARTAADIEAAGKSGKLAATAGFEGAHLIDGNLNHIDEMAERHGLYLTLAHFSKNQACTPGMGKGANQEDGLTEFGKALVKKLNDAKMLVDVAHVNEPGVLDAARASQAPVIATHTCAKGVHHHARGITDEGFKAIAETGGVAGVIFSPGFLKGKLNASLDAVVEHAKYIADLVGPEHLALGTDFDGWIPTIPNDIRDCRDMPAYSQRLMDAGFSRDEVAGLMGGNLMRVIREVRGA
ncbi:MAG: membrane dipeptidase [Myxococcales bacterium]|nr:membrane dipeptidase [Myxococcales bacterium]